MSFPIWVWKLKKHASRKKHQSVTGKVSFFLLKKKKHCKSNDPTGKKSVETINPQDTYPITISSWITVMSSKKLEAKIGGALYCLFSRQSDNSNNDSKKFSKQCSLITVLLRLFLCCDKLLDVINKGFSSLFQRTLLQKKVSQPFYYAVTFDKSLCDITRKFEVNLIIRYLGNIDKKVKIRFCNKFPRTRCTYKFDWAFQQIDGNFELIDIYLRVDKFYTIT